MELISVFDEEGKPTGRSVPRGSKDEVFAPNEHIGVSIIFIENNSGEFLIQKTSKERGGLFSSTGGHIDKDEKPKDVIVREVKEELGIDIKKNEIEELGFRLLDFPIRFLYYLKKDIDIKNTKIQKSEVESVHYMSEMEVKSLIYNGYMNKGHALLFREIMKYKYNINTFNDVYLKYKEKYEVNLVDENTFTIKINGKKNVYRITVYVDSIYIEKKKTILKKELWLKIDYHSHLMDDEYSNEYFSDTCDKIDNMINNFKEK